MPDNDVVSRVDVQSGITIKTECDGNMLHCRQLSLWFLWCECLLMAELKWSLSWQQRSHKICHKSIKQPLELSMKNLAAGEIWRSEATCSTRLFATSWTDVGPSLRPESPQSAKRGSYEELGDLTCRYGMGQKKGLGRGNEKRVYFLTQQKEPSGPVFWPPTIYGRTAAFRQQSRSGRAPADALYLPCGASDAKRPYCRAPQSVKELLQTAR